MTLIMGDDDNLMIHHDMNGPSATVARRLRHVRTWTGHVSVRVRACAARDAELRVTCVCDQEALRPRLPRQDQGACSMQVCVCVNADVRVCACRVACACKHAASRCACA